MVLLSAGSFLDTLKEFDAWLFIKINNDWTSPFFDNVFPWWRDQNSSLPLYLFLFTFLLLNFGWKFWPWLLCAIITVSLTEAVSSHWLKDFINRPRPCNDEFFAPHVRLLLGHCPGSGSFTSSHAANHFGQAAFYYYSLRPYLKKWALLFFFWAATISYGQIYIGVHYPLDVLGGAVIGFFFGASVAGIFNRRIGMPPLKALPADA